jgi:Pentapeptide repeats (8 copies)
MKTFFTIIEKNTQKELGVFPIFDARSSAAEGLAKESNVASIACEGKLTSEGVQSQELLGKDIFKDGGKTEPLNGDFPLQAGGNTPESVTIEYQLYFMLNSMNYYIKKQKKSEKTLITNINKKFKYYTETINNMFLNSNTKKIIQEIFCKSQRNYHAFLHFAQRVRIKLAKMSITNDLSMAPIEPNQKNIVTIYQNKTKYPFTLSDIINIILTAITNAPSLFPEPLIPKNPYNNVPLSKSILYHIYWAIKSSNILMPSLINAYFRSNFNLNDFIINNEQAVREYAIKRYVINSPVTVLYDEIMQMLENNYSIVKDTLDVDPNFPKVKLVEIMKPYLYLYIMKNDGIRGTEKRRVSNLLFKRELLNFVKYNPQFGRRTINTTRKIRTNNTGLRSPSSGGFPPFDSESAELIIASNHGKAPPSAPLFTPKREIKTIVFNTSNPGLTISKIEKMYKNYTTIIAKNSEEYDSETSYDSEDEIERNSVVITQDDIDHDPNPFMSVASSLNTIQRAMSLDQETTLPSIETNLNETNLNETNLNETNLNETNLEFNTATFQVLNSSIDDIDFTSQALFAAENTQNSQFIPELNNTFVESFRNNFNNLVERHLNLTQRIIYVNNIINIGQGGIITTEESEEGEIPDNDSVS